MDKAKKQSGPCLVAKGPTHQRVGDHYRNFREGATEFAHSAEGRALRSALNAGMTVEEWHAFRRSAVLWVNRREYYKRAQGGPQ
jgi:hypothetical protein